MSRRIAPWLLLCPALADWTAMEGELMNNSFVKEVEGEGVNAVEELLEPRSRGGSRSRESLELSESYAWNAKAVLLALALLLCPLGCCSCCLLVAAREKDCGAGSVSTYHLLAVDEESFATSVRWQMYLMPSCLLICLVGFPWTTCAAGSPLWLYALYLPLLSLSKYAEYQLIVAWQRRQLEAEQGEQGEEESDSEGSEVDGWDFSLWTNFLFWGCLEHLDFFTDGCLPLQAWRCEQEHVSTALAVAWAEGSQPWMAPLVQHVQLWGLMAAVLAMSTFTQQCLGVLASAAQRGASQVLAADAASMLGLASLLEDVEKSAEPRIVFVGVSKIFLENVLQLSLQSSFLALLFDRMTPLGRGKVLFSILLGLFSVVKGTMKSVLVVTRGLRSSESRCLVVALWVFLSFNFAALSCVVWTVLKLYHMLHCPSRLWNFDGCVET